MKKLLGLLAATGLVASTGASVVACQSSDKTDISILELEVELGNVEGANSQLTNTEIIEAFVKNETNASILADAELTAASFEVTGEPTTTKATIAVKSDVTTHTGSVDVTFTRVEPTTPAEKTDISKMEDLVTELGDIDTTEEIPTEGEIIAKFVELNNSKLEGLTVDSFEVAETPAPTATEATIAVKSAVTTHTGSVDVTFIIDNEAEAGE